MIYKKGDQIELIDGTLAFITEIPTCHPDFKYCITIGPVGRPGVRVEKIVESSQIKCLHRAEDDTQG